jgi:hypothetical protein
MAPSEQARQSFSRTQRWAIVFNTVLAVSAVLALVIMANYLAAGYFKRFQLSRDAAFKLSQQTIRVLDNLTNDVNVTIFFQPAGANSEIYQLTKALLAEYQHASPRHIHVTTLDYTRYAGEAKELLATNNFVGLKEKDFVLFESKGHSKIIFAKELADYDFSDLLTGRSKYIRRSAFKGEMYFTGDIYAVSYPQTVKTYFLYGHGENNPGDPRGDDANLGPSGYSKLAAILKKEIDSDWDRLSLEGTNTVPADCQLLIIAAGANEGNIPPEELGKISAYLKQGGRLLALLTVHCGLGPVLAQWGLALGTNRVVTDKDFNIDRYTFYTAQWVPHPIVNPLASEDLRVRMVVPWPVYNITQQAKVPGAPEVSYLAVTSTNGYDERMRRQAYPLLAAVEQGVINGVNSPRAGGTRIVVAGDSDFLDDEVIDTVAGNHYFAWGALNWLLDRQPILLAGLGPQPIREYNFYMTRSQTRTVQWLFLAAMPGAVLGLGALVWLRRRS